MTSEELRRQRVREVGERIMLEMLGKWSGGFIVHKDGTCPEARSLVSVSLAIAEEFIEQSGIN